MAALTAYIDVPALARGGVQLGQIRPYVGGNSALSAAVAQAAVSLPLYNSKGFKPGDPVFLLDGPNSEQVYAAAPNPVPDGHTLTIQAPGCALAHSANVSVSSPGTRGSLADMILRASSWVEEFTENGTTLDRSFFSASRTERTYMPSTRALIDNWYSLVFRPRWLPITAVSALSVEFAPGDTITLDPTQVEFESEGRVLTLPQMAATQSHITSPAWLFGPPVSRYDQAWLVVQHTAGFAAGSVPYSFAQAVTWTVQGFLAMAQNALGAVALHQEDVNVSYRQTRGGTRSHEDVSDNIFIAKAKESLLKWKQVLI